MCDCEDPLKTLVICGWFIRAISEAYQDLFGLSSYNRSINVNFLSGCFEIRYSEFFLEMTTDTMALI